MTKTTPRVALTKALFVGAAKSCENNTSCGSDKGVVLAGVCAGGGGDKKEVESRDGESIRRILHMLIPFSRLLCKRNIWQRKAKKKCLKSMTRLPSPPMPSNGRVVEKWGDL